MADRTPILSVPSNLSGRIGWRDMFARLEGPQTMGRGPVFRGLMSALLIAGCIHPVFRNDYSVGNTAYFFVWTFMATGLCVVWGYGGAQSFGQTAFLACLVTLMAFSRSMSALLLALPGSRSSCRS